MGQSVRVVTAGIERAGETGVIVKLLCKVRLYRVRFADGFECVYFYTHLAAAC